MLANGALLLGQRGYISRCGPDATILGFMVSGCLHGGREWVRLSPAFVSFKMINTVWSPWDFGWKIPFPWALCITLVEFRQLFSCAKKTCRAEGSFYCELGYYAFTRPLPGRCWEWKDAECLTIFLGRWPVFPFLNMVESMVLKTALSTSIGQWTSYFQFKGEARGVGKDW